VQDINKAIGQRIRSQRLAKGLSQEELADSSGLNRSHLGLIERGESTVTVTTLQIVGSRLGMSVSALLKGVA